MVSERGADESGEPSGEDSERMVDNRTIIFTLLFGVMGFLGIPLLWSSRSFTREEKKKWSIIVTIYTCVLISITAGICWWSYSVVSKTLGW